MNDLPMADRRMLVTRTSDQAPMFSREMKARGAIPVEVPVIALHPPADRTDIKRSLVHLSAYHWIIFTSRNGIRFFFQALHEEKRTFPPNVKVAAVGKKTLQALQEYGVDADVVPDEFVAEKLLEQLKPLVQPNERILLPRGNLSRKMLAEELADLGADVSDLVCYETVANQENRAALIDTVVKQDIDVLTFTSSSTFQAFVELLEGIDWRSYVQDVKIACIGPITAKTVKEYGLVPDIVAQKYSTSGLLDAIEQFFRGV